jgi:hypothetical protein
MTDYQCLYNHEIAVVFLSQTAQYPHSADVSDEYVKLFVEELANTQVDCLMFCPTIWRMKLWGNEAKRIVEQYRDAREPGVWENLKFYERGFWRTMRYLRTGADPVKLTAQTAKAQNLDLCISYRMNDCHYYWDLNCSSHDSFSRDHRELAFADDDIRLCYSHQETRQYYLDILKELVYYCEADGVELDFMRSLPVFAESFNGDKVAIMSDFVHHVRAMLNQAEAQLGKKLKLGIRMPATPQKALDNGFDLSFLDREQLIDMVNVTTSFCFSPQAVDVEGYRKILNNAKLYAECLHHSENGIRHMRSNFRNNILRKTTPEQYRTATHGYLERGVDGLSFFNFSYSRNNNLGEPRRRGITDPEPPYDILQDILNYKDYANENKHYLLNYDFGGLPLRIDQKSSKSITLDIYADPGNFNSALVKIEAFESLWVQPLQVCVNAVEAELTHLTGELFEPETFEALPAKDCTLTFRIPVSALRRGHNTITISLPEIIGWITDNSINCSRVELALIR